jgi:hypothetical protein
VRVACPAGRHILWAEIPAAAHIGRLRLDPGYAPGDFLLHALEIRCEAEALRGLLVRALTPLARLWPRRRPKPVAVRFSEGREVFAIAPELRHFGSVSQVEVSPVESGLLLRSLGDDPRINLPAFDLPGRAMVARLEATSAIETTAQIFWETRADGYCESQSAAARLKPGVNCAYFAIPRDAVGRLRFDPAMSPGDVILHTLEFRAER